MNLQQRMTEHIVSRAWKAARTRSAALEIRYEGGTEHDMAQWLGDRIALVEQGAGDIGARMHSAFKAIFQKGGRKAILIGSDCPGITATLLQNSLDALSDCDLVLGPAADGGYYLIGLTRPCPPLFRSIGWGTSEVLEQTLTVARRLGLTVRLVDRLHDVDRPEDLVYLAGMSLETWGSMCPGRIVPTCPRISVIIPALNEEHTILPCLERVLMVPNVEIIVVDGGSIDRTRSWRNPQAPRFWKLTGEERHR